mmetsp:Transcript_4261/g.10651  ORF Transcript_4261/g.10651 Transcript_4261/m.10651 type:complete len:241 (-) Transcript_4261:349-1071(-)
MMTMTVQLWAKSAARSTTKSVVGRQAGGMHSMSTMMTTSSHNKSIDVFSFNSPTTTATMTAMTAMTSTSIVTTTTTRQYRGDSGVERQSNDLSQQEQELISIAKPKADMIFQRHIELPQEVHHDDGLTTRQKRLIYRSKQRGWLEVDLLLGTWASENVTSLNDEELDQFEHFVNQETIDIYNIITLRVDVPPELKTQTSAAESGQKPSIVEQIQEWARSHPLGKADPQQYIKVKTEHNMI